MSASKFVFILQVFVLVACERRHSKKPRLFTFNTEDDDIKIDLEFSIPFISIPVKRAMETALGMTPAGLPTININPASLALGGVMLIGTTVLVPLFIKSYAENNPQQKYARMLETAEFKTAGMLDLASEMLFESRNVRGCVLRVSCWTGQRPGPDVMKIWDYMLSNQRISTMINTTEVEDAMLSGQQGRDCSTYTPCPLKEDHKPLIITNMLMFAKLL